MRTIHELMDLRGRAALVVGGAGHIGRACGDALGELGARIAVMDIDASGCEAAAASHRDAHAVESIAAPCDISNPQDLEKAVSEVIAGLGSLDILILCASLVGTSPLEGWTTSFDAQSLTTWRLALETNLTANFSLLQRALPALKASGNGTVVTVLSTYALVGPDLRLYDDLPMGSPAAYAASKGGLLAFTRWAATVLAPEVRCNSISPGGVLRGQDRRFVDRYADRTPLGRMATEEDLKGAVAYLSSDLSSYVTGHNLVVDGGWTAW